MSIQDMHDKYYYEAAEMALIDTDVRRTFATGIAGFSHVVDSLSAIKYAKVKTVRDETGLVIGYETEGDTCRLHAGRAGVSVAASIGLGEVAACPGRMGIATVA